MSILVLTSSNPGSLGEALRTVEGGCAGSNPARNRSFFRTKFMFISKRSKAFWPPALKLIDLFSTHLEA